MKVILCKKCGITVGELLTGTKLRKGTTFLCFECSYPQEKNPYQNSQENIFKNPNMKFKSGNEDISPEEVQNIMKNLNINFD